MEEDLVKVGEVWVDTVSRHLEIVLKVDGPDHVGVARYYPHNGEVLPRTVESARRDDWECDMVQVTSLKEIVEIYKDVS